MRASKLALSAALLLTSGVAVAAETVTYRYDARGRLVEVAWSAVGPTRDAVEHPPEYRAGR